jgi:hypothetical protein
VAADKGAWANDYLMETHCEAVNRTSLLGSSRSARRRHHPEPRPRARPGHRDDPLRDPRLRLGRDRRPQGQRASMSSACLLRDELAPMNSVAALRRPVQRMTRSTASASSTSRRCSRGRMPRRCSVTSAPTW